MIENSAPFVHFGKSNFETVVRVADITLESMERLVDLQTKTAKDALEQSIRNVNAFAAVRNVQDFVVLQSKAAQPNLERALAYSRNVYAVATDAQERISRALKTHMSGLGVEITSAVDEAARSEAAPEAVAAAFKSVIVGNGQRAPARRMAAKRKTAKKKIR